MAIKPLNNHYSFENPATIFDEESLTALQLAGRTAAKVNEVVEQSNKLDEDVREKLDVFEHDTIPNTIEAEVLAHINDGSFDAQIDESLEHLNERVDNLLGSVKQGSTTLDAEVIDIRTAFDGKTYPNAGEAVRNQFLRSMTMNGYLPTRFETLADISESGTWIVAGTSAQARPDQPVVGAYLISSYVSETGLKYQVINSHENFKKYIRKYQNNAWSDWFIVGNGINTEGVNLSPSMNGYIPASVTSLDDVTENGSWIITPDYVIAGTLPYKGAHIFTNYSARGDLQYQSIVSHNYGNRWSRWRLSTGIWSEWKRDIYHSLVGHKITFIGDSITEHNYRANSNWVDRMKAIGVDTQNLGVSGTGFANGFDDNTNFINRIGSIAHDTELIGVALSFNDLASSVGLPVGSAKDSGTATICGYINAFFDRLASVHPTKPVCAYVQSPWASYHYGTNDEKGTALVNAFEEICKLRGIPFKSLYTGSGLRPWDAAHNEHYFKAPDYAAGDGIHPNDAGHKVIFRHLLPFFEECMPTADAM